MSDTAVKKVILVGLCTFVAGLASANHDWTGLIGWAVAAIVVGVI